MSILAEASARPLRTQTNQGGRLSNDLADVTGHGFPDTACGAGGGRWQVSTDNGTTYTDIVGAVSSLLLRIGYPFKEVAGLAGQHCAHGLEGRQPYRFRSSVLQDGHVGWSDTHPGCELGH